MARLNDMLYDWIDFVQQMEFLGQQHRNQIHVNILVAIEAVQMIPRNAWVIEGMLTRNGYSQLGIKGSTMQALLNVVAHVEIFTNIAESLRKRQEDRWSGAI